MPRVTDKRYYMDGYLKKQLDFYKKCIAKNWDIVILIDGREGSGKSTLASSICYYLDRGFNIDNIVYTPQQFIKAVDNANIGTAIMYDEFVLAGLSTDFMTEVQKTIIKKMTTIRKKRLYIIWVIPSLFMLGSYFVERSRALFHVFSPDGISRGLFTIYGGEIKDRLYHKGKKAYRNYNIVTPDFKCRFRDCKGLFYVQKEYEDKKDEAIKNIQLFDKEEDNENRPRCQRCQSHYVQAYVNNGGYRCRKCGFTLKKKGLPDFNMGG